MRTSIICIMVMVNCHFIIPVTDFNQVNHSQQLATNWSQNKYNFIPTKTKTETQASTKKFNVKSSRGVPNINLSIAKVERV